MVADVVGFVRGSSPHKLAALDMDTCLVKIDNQEALDSYKKHEAYQPGSTYWAEVAPIVHAEFCDGNERAGHAQLRVFN